MPEITYKLEKFEGPLDLLLHLIERDKIDIFDIPIVQITAEYLDYVSHMEEENLDIVSDFLVMAATLLEIKSRMLLPKEVDEETGEEVDPRAELVERLLEYRKYKLMGQILQEREDDADRYYYKGPTIPKEVEKYVPPIDMDELLKKVSLESLKTVFEDVMRRKEDSIDKVRSKFGVIKKEKISLEGRIRDVLKYVRGHHKFSFRHMIRKKKDKMDVVVSFLAILELMKMGRITLVQEIPFGDMDITEVDDPNQSDDDLDLTNLEDL
ncbi:segregation and condensation protein A [Oribacterium sp. WCC10]|uniref:segregation and condensation protein A n=1 Tax=Oribacterium sp. WCC10 TaxID=1855343 RepID=UPI0008E28942|nr:segregation/condensation protein A [Oribacterium sp. WCC10]SFG19338.1 condensin subunit ScpA [Oribacterium sp. WCC10]